MKNLCEQAALYFYGELAELQASAFKAHLEGCPTCQKELAFLEKTQAALVPPAAPQDVVKRVLRKARPMPFWRRIYKPVLAAAIIASFGILVFTDSVNMQSSTEENQGWLAYVSEELDSDYQDFLSEFEAFEAEF